MSFAGCVWLNEPGHWRITAETLSVKTDQASDFWRTTHYGFVRDTGHFFGRDTTGPFTAQLRIRARFDELYDQAGIMVRCDAERWLKAGIEKSDGRCLMSSVLTMGSSDWATGPFDGDPGDFWMRVTVGEGVLRVQCSADGETWPLVRLAPFPAAATYRVGPMCCTPERAGLRAAFSDFEVGLSPNRALHDLS